MVKQSNLLNYFIGTSISAIGSTVSYIALIWLVLQMTGKESAVGEIVGGFVLIYALARPLSGIFVDRVDRKKIIVILDLLRGVNVFVIPFLGLQFGFLNMKWIWVYLLISTVLEVPVNQARFSIVPSIIANPAQLVKVNSIESTLMQITSLAGPALGGMLIAFFDIKLIFLFDGVSYFVSSLCTYMIKINKTVKSNIVNEGFGIKAILLELKEGFMVITHSSFLKWFVVYNTLLNFFIGPLFIIAPLISNETNHGALGYGFLQTLMALGLLCSSSIVGLANFRFNKIAILICGNIVFSAVFILYGWIPSYIVATIVFFVAGIALVGGKVFGFTLLQENTPNKDLGKVEGLTGFIGQILQPITLTLSTLLIEKYSLNIIILVLALVSVTISLVAFSGVKDKEFFVGAKTDEKIQNIKV